MKKIIVLTLFMFSAVTYVQAQKTVQCSEETEEKNKALARKFYEKVYFSNNPAVIDEVFAPQYVAHDIGERKNVTETPDKQKEVAAFFWNNGNISGSIDYQIAECDLVATRWQGKFDPKSSWMKLLVGNQKQIPIINVFRFKDGKIVEIWNHRHDIDSVEGTFMWLRGLLIGLIPSFVLLVISFGSAKKVTAGYLIILKQFLVIVLL